MKSRFLTFVYCFVLLPVFGQGIRIDVYNNGVTNGAVAFEKNGGWGGPSLIGFGGHLVFNDAGTSGDYTIQWGGPQFAFDQAHVTNLVGHYTPAASGPAKQYTVYVPINGQGTNCTVAVNINNSASYPAAYAILYQGSPSGYFVYVNAGATWSGYIPDPNCDPAGWSYVRVMNGTINSTGPNQQQTTSGYLVNAANWSGLNYQTPSDGGNLNITMGPPGGGQTLPSANTDAGPQPTPQPNQTTNGPINYGNSGAVLTNTLNNGTFESGQNAVNSSIVNGDTAIINAIRDMDQANRAGHANTTSNLSSQTSVLHSDLTNMLGRLGSTNGLTTNDLQNLGQYEQGQESNKLSGAIGQMMAATNAAGNVGSGSLQSAAANANNGLGVGNGNLDSYSIAIGGAGVSMNIVVSPLSSPSVGIMHDLIKWLCYVFLFIANYKVFKDAMYHALQAPQARTAGEEVLGNNVNFASALVMAGVIVAVIATIPAFFLPQLVTAIGNVIGSPFSALSSLPGWGWVMAACPVDTMVTVFGSHILFRLAVDGFVFVVCATIRFLVGL